MKTPNKNVVGIGMAGAFVEPMEANSLYVAQACIQLVHRLINRAKDEDAVISPHKFMHTIETCVN